MTHKRGHTQRRILEIWRKHKEQSTEEMISNRLVERQKT